MNENITPTIIVFDVDKCEPLLEVSTLIAVGKEVGIFDGVC